MRADGCCGTVCVVGVVVDVCSSGVYPPRLVKPQIP
jgi:hypothetical protein